MTNAKNKTLRSSIFTLLLFNLFCMKTHLQRAAEIFNGNPSFATFSNKVHGFFLLKMYVFLHPGKMHQI